METNIPTGGTPVNILAIGRDHAILEVIQRLINAHEHWHATIVTTEEGAIEATKQKRFAIALVSAGFSLQEEERIRQKFAQLSPRTVVIRHFGGGSGLLENEILGILNQDQQ